MTEAVKKTSDELAQERTDMAVERTALANDRTLMAWIRTAVSLISFGFTIYKFFQEIAKGDESYVHSRILSAREVGMIMITFGLLGLFFAILQYRTSMKSLKAAGTKLPKSYTMILAVLILIFGFMLFLSALFRQ